MLTSIRFYCFQLIFIDHFRVVEQAADQRTFTVIDAATCQEPKQSLCFQIRSRFADDECYLKVGIWVVMLYRLASSLEDLPNRKLCVLQYAIRET